MARRIDEATKPCYCLRPNCGYTWFPRLPSGEKPKQCPKCKSTMWDKLPKSIRPTVRLK